VPRKQSGPEKESLTSDSPSKERQDEACPQNNKDDEEMKDCERKFAPSPEII